MGYHGRRDGPVEMKRNGFTIASTAAVWLDSTTQQDTKVHIFLVGGGSTKNEKNERTKKRNIMVDKICDRVFDNAVKYIAYLPILYNTDCIICLIILNHWFLVCFVRCFCEH